jgi:D-3-phosphoglycerate dehydrogenase / 2-oxoglutarate reductase
MNVLLLEQVHPRAVDILQQAGMSVRSEPKSLSGSALDAALEGVSILGIGSRTQITATVLDHAPDLLVIGACCIGTNQIDLDAASHRGIAVFNAPYSNTRSVAELVIGEIIFLIRMLNDKVAAAHRGVWDKSAEQAREVRGKKSGIVGFGNIRSHVCTLAEAMGV